MDIGHIPGYYYDADKRKYFKIVANHVGGRFSKEIVGQLEKQRLKDESQARNTKAVKEQLVQRNPILSSSLVGRAGLTRESDQHSYPNAHVENRKQAFGNALDTSWGTKFKFQISSLIFDVDTQQFLLGTRCDHSYSMLRTHSSYYHGAPSAIGAFGPNEITSLSLSPSRTVVVTAAEDSGGTVNFYKLTETDPSELDQYKGTRPKLGSEPGVIFRPSSESTTWCSTANPFIHDYSMFVVGMSDCSIQFANNESGWNMIHSNKARSDVMAADFLTASVVSLGHRNGSVKLWDLRSHGHSLRLQHPARITGLRRLSDHSLAICGLQSSLATYDLRMPRQTKTSPPAAKRRNTRHSQKRKLETTTEPTMIFNYENDSNQPLGFDVDTENDLVAVANDRCGIEIFSLSTGQRVNRFSREYLNVSLSENQPYDLVRSLKFVHNKRRKEDDYPDYFLLGTTWTQIHGLD